MEQPDFVIFECRICEFTSVQRKDFDGEDWCPLCLSDSHHFVHMTRRTCLTTDEPEGRDARKET